MSLEYNGMSQITSRTNRERKFERVNVPGERILLSAKVPGSECSRANSLRGTKVPGSELSRVLLADSLQGANWPGSEKAVNPDYQGLR